MNRLIWSQFCSVHNLVNREICVGFANFVSNYQELHGRGMKTIWTLELRKELSSSGCENERCRRGAITAITIAIDPIIIIMITIKKWWGDIYKGTLANIIERTFVEMLARTESNGAKENTKTTIFADTSKIQWLINFCPLRARILVLCFFFFTRSKSPIVCCYRETIALSDNN